MKRALPGLVLPMPGLATAAEENWLERSRNWLTETWQSLSDWMDIALFSVSDTPVTTAGIVKLLVILTVAWWISKLGRKGLTRIATYRPIMEPASIYTLGRVFHYTILTLGFIVGLSSIGIDFSKFALFASALGVGVGFGLQNLISNFVAGLMLLFERSLKVGDFVELESGITGEVREIKVRSTLITTNDNVDIVVPNSEFVNRHVVNWTMRDTIRRTHIPFGVAYGSDKDKVRQAALEAADRVTHTLKDVPGREPQVWLVNFGNSSLDFELIVWLTAEAVKRPGVVTADYLWEIESALKRHGIEIPFPQRDLHIRSWQAEAAVPRRLDDDRDTR